MQTTPPQKPLSSIHIALISILVAIITFALKYLAYLTTGSVALYSDALESLVNLATAVAAWLAVHISHQPPDRHHPYGHHKIEYIVAVAEGVAIGLAAILIAKAAISALSNTTSPHFASEGIGLSLTATIINAFWAWILVSQGRKRRSPALQADGHHLWSDVISSLSIFAGFVIMILSGWAWLDSILALGVALQILYAGGKVMWSSLHGLMDAGVSRETDRALRDVIANHAEGALEAHDLRTRVAGPVTFIDLHLVVPAAMTVVDSHAICDLLEQAIERLIPGAITTIHVEPEGWEKRQAKGVISLNNTK